MELYTTSKITNYLYDIKWRENERISVDKEKYYNFIHNVTIVKDLFYIIPIAQGFRHSSIIEIK